MDSEPINHYRRRFIGTAAIAIAAAQLGMIGPKVEAGTTYLAQLPATRPGTNTSSVVERPAEAR